MLVHLASVPPRGVSLAAKLDVAVLSITGGDVVLSTVPSFAHHVVGTHSRQGNTGRPRSEAALLESKLDGSWIANPEAFSCCCMLRPHSPALGPGPGFWQIRLGTPGALLRRQQKCPPPRRGPVRKAQRSFAKRLERPRGGEPRPLERERHRDGSQLLFKRGCAGFVHRPRSAAV